MCGDVVVVGKKEEAVTCVTISCQCFPSFMAGRIDLLILGAGWTSTFLIPLCVTQNISYAATRRTPTVPGEIAFTFDPDSDDPEPYAALPPARTVLITFPIRVADASARLVRLYTSTHLVEDDGLKTKFIQLGSTGVWDVSTFFPCCHSLLT